jgi:excisionase family DNA binding protein
MVHNKPPEVGMGDKVLLTIPEVAAKLSIGRSVTYQLVMRGEIASIKVGKCRRVPVGEVERFVGRLIAEQTGGEAA